MSYPLGYQINNPGDLRDEGITWQGRIGSREGFVHFDTPEHGIRALLVDLHTKYARDGLHTVRDIVEKFAPPGDNNPTEKYIQNVCDYLQCSDSDDLNLVTDHNILLHLATAIIRQELGGSADAPAPLPADWYSDDVYSAAYDQFAGISDAST